jgi:predicted HTH domain antitoxin
MRTLQFNLPDNIEIDDNEARMFIASKLFEKGKLTSGQAADLTGLSKRAFLELLSYYDVSIFNYPIQELDNDIKNAKSYSL